jgi:hypothetical protein
LFFKELRFRFFVGDLYFMLRIIEGRNEVGKTGSGKLE